jgi:hypothetical protein
MSIEKFSVKELSYGTRSRLTALNLDDSHKRFVTLLNRAVSNSYHQRRNEVSFPGVRAKWSSCHRNSICLLKSYTITALVCLTTFRHIPKMKFSYNCSFLWLHKTLHCGLSLHFNYISSYIGSCRDGTHLCYVTILWRSF